MRIVVTGYPNSGKTTLAKLLSESMGWERSPDSPIIPWSTDSLIDTHQWSELSATVSEWLDLPGPWVIEGVACPRAIRKWRKANEGEPPPFEAFVYIRRLHMDYRPGQRAMANGLDTVMVELWAWLDEHDVQVYHLGPPPKE